MFVSEVSGGKLTGFCFEGVKSTKPNWAITLAQSYGQDTTFC